MRDNRFKKDGRLWKDGEKVVAWEEKLGVGFYHEDVSWLNVYGYELRNVRLDKKGKIIGDE